jgi:hypothetical protein
LSLFKKSPAEAGRFRDTADSGSADLYVLELDGAGQVLSAISAGGPRNVSGKAIAISAAGHSYVSGTFTGTATFGKTTISSKGSTDAFVWRRQ